MEKRIKNIGIVMLYFFVVFFIFHVTKSLTVLKTDGIDKWTEAIESNMRTAPFSTVGMTTVNFKIFATLSFIAICMLSMYIIDNNKKYMQGKEHGSADWATKKDSESLSAYEGKNNIIMTQTEKVNLNTRESGRNLNTIVIGGPGTGKTRNFVKPNLMQMNTSYITTDPKGELVRSTYKMMKKNGYVVKVLNLIDMNCGDTYNPFAYIKNENDILIMVDTLIMNTSPEGQRSSEPFWEKAETALLQAICFYLYYMAPPEEQNFSVVMEFIRNAEVKEDNENYISKTDVIFNELEKKNPYHIAVKQYRIFKQAAGKTAKTILVSVSVRLAAFNIKDVKNLTSTDTLDLRNIAQEKTILYIVVSDSYATFNFIAAMLYSQLFSELYYEADFNFNGQLPIHTRFILDEFANIGLIPGFDKKIATARSREISITIIIQNLGQLKGMYKEKWENLISNCDQFLYLGTQELSTWDYLVQSLGKRTIFQKGSSLTRGRNRSSNVSENLIGRELLTKDEIRRLKRDKCILLVSGIKPFLSKKYNIKKHKKYKEYKELDGFNFKELKRIHVDIRKIPKFIDVPIEDEKCNIATSNKSENEIEIEDHESNITKKEELNFSDL